MGGFFEGSKKMSKIRLWYGLHNPPNIIKYTEMYTLSGCTGWHVEYISITITMLKSNVEKQYKAKRNKNKIPTKIKHWAGIYQIGLVPIPMELHVLRSSHTFANWPHKEGVGQRINECKSTMFQ